MSKCNDVLFWDLTHNTTKYPYKRSTFTLVDSENCSIAVHFCLTVRESASECKQMLVNLAFNVRLLRIIFTDGDEAMHVAIPSIPYSDQILHLICIFHLFHINAEDRVQPVLISITRFSTWPGFRHSLSLCREASSPTQLRSFWMNMLY